MPYCSLQIRNSGVGQITKGDFAYEFTNHSMIKYFAVYLRINYRHQAANKVCLFMGPAIKKTTSDNPDSSFLSPLVSCKVGSKSDVKLPRYVIHEGHPWTMHYRFVSRQLARRVVLTDSPIDRQAA